jgi:hypothetical protein
MTTTRSGVIVALLALHLPIDLSAQTTTWRQTQADDYTRYELLDPASRSFRILYDVSATAAGARYFFNGLRAGSEHTMQGVVDLMTGAALEWSVVDGRAARETGWSNANPDEQYLKVTLPRPVPTGGEVRLRIDKTYRDTASYISSGRDIVFSRSLGIKRNSVVLPAGYEEPDGRIKVSFLNTGPAAVPYRVRGRPRPAVTGNVPAEVARTTRPAQAPAPAPAGTAGQPFTFTERAFQDREIVYFLKQPETHSFSLYHDYTESRPGVDRYLNVVRAGSTVSDPSAMMLDTGQPLRVETLKGEDITRRGVDIGSPVTASSEVAVVWFEPVRAGQSVRLRITETYTDPNRYFVSGGVLTWDRSFGRPRNAMVLPEGWYVTASSAPAVVTEGDDGRIRLDYNNDRPDELRIYVTARRR